MKNGLLKNENIKVYRQTSSRVLIIILLALFVLIPVANFYFNKVLISMYTLEDRYKNSLDNAEYHEELLNKDGNDSYFRIYAAYYRSEAEAVKFFIDNNLADTWKSDLFLFQYVNAMNRLTGLRLIVEDGFSYWDVMQSGLFSIDDYSKNPYPSYEYYGEYYGYNPPKVVYEYSYGDEYEILEPTDEELKALYEKSKKEVADLRQQILNFAFTEYLENELKGKKTELANYENQLDLMRQYAQAHPGDESQKAQIAYMEELVKNSSEIIKYYEKLVASKPEAKDWRYNTISNLIPRVQQTMSSIKAVSEDDFNNSYRRSNYKSYKSYLEDIEKQKAKAQKAYEILKYSLDKNIPTPESMDDSGKQIWQNQLDNAVTLTGIFMIILAGTIMANEYSSGSIRLLLIRPKKRTKILTSKIVCTIVWSYGLLIVAMVLMFILNFIFYGTSDFFAPDIYHTGNHMLLLPGVVTAIRNIAILSLPHLFIAGLALLFSILTKKAALSIALPLIINLLGSGISAIIPFLSNFMPVLNYTILPYFSMSSFIKGPLESTLNSYGSILGGGNTLESGLVLGCIILVLHIALVTFLSYLSFTKQQIKN